MIKRKVSIIIVCLNAAEMLEKTLRTSAAQTFPDKEIIVVDGASTDDSISIIKRYEEAIDKWVSEPDGGIYDAMNKGVGMAEGEWCIFMNAGDVFADDNVLARVFAGHRDADVIYGDVIKKGRNGKPAVKKAERPHNSHRMFFCHQCVFTKTDCLRAFPYDTRHRMSADFKLYKQLLKAGKSFEYVEMPIAIFDTEGVSNTNRAGGIADNISVVWEIDSFTEQVRLLPRLCFQWIMCKIRKNKK